MTNFSGNPKENQNSYALHSMSMNSIGYEEEILAILIRWLRERKQLRRSREQAIPASPTLTPEAESWIREMESFDRF